jgi:hypothetical protein
VNDRGSVGILFLALLLFLGAILSGLSGYFGTASRLEAASEAAYAQRLSLEAAAGEVLAILAADESPESDSPRDAVWSALGRRDEGIEVSLEDASSGLNPNFAPIELLESPDIATIFAPSSSAAALIELRRKGGMSTEPSRYAGLFEAEAKASLSLFGWADINTTDRDALGSLFLSLTRSGDKAEALLARLDAARSEKRDFLPEELPSFLGDEYESLRPMICIAAPHNAQFAPARLIRAIFSIPSFALADASFRAEALIKARDDHDLREEELASLCGTAPHNRALRFLGLRTWFWRIRAESHGHAYSTVAATSPSLAAQGPARLYRIIETRFE